MKTEFISDAQGRRRAVIMPVRDYEKLLKAHEDLEDIHAYDAVKARNKPPMTLSEYIAKRMADYKVSVSRAAQNQLDSLLQAVTVPVLPVFSICC